MCDGTPTRVWKHSCEGIEKVSIRIFRLSDDRRLAEFIEFSWTVNSGDRLLRLQPVDTGADESGGDCRFVDALEVAKLPQCVTAAVEEPGIDQGRSASHKNN
jgi:hypothetical protein